MSRGRSRGVSTVLDVALFLLLVSAAVLSVATAAGDAGTTDSAARDEATVATLATTTATVRYELGVDERTNEPLTRVTHGSLAELLAEATVASAGTNPGDVRSPYAARFVAAVAEAVRPVLDGRTQVGATWTPYPGSTLAGRVSVGPVPPPDATVHAATLTVDSGFPAVRTPASAASPDYRTVAESVATPLVDGLFPVRSTDVVLAGDGADATVTRAQFDAVRSAYGSNATLDDGVVHARNDLTAAVTDRTEQELRREFETPGDAAAAVRLDRVTVVVRTWS
jgi:hypothetical protein